MKSTRFLVTLMLVFVLAVSCLQAVTVSALAEDNYVGFSLTEKTTYYHLIYKLFSFENRRSETFERQYKVYNPTDHDVLVQFEVVNIATWGPTTKSAEVPVPAQSSKQISTGNITVDGDGKIVCRTSAGGVSEILLTDAVLRVNIIGAGDYNNQLSAGEKLYFEPLDEAELSWYNNGTTSTATFGTSASIALEKELPVIEGFVGWRISSSTQYYHMIGDTFSFEMNRAGTSFVRAYDIYNLSDRPLYVMLQLDGSWKEYANGTTTMIPAGGHGTVSTNNIVVDADGYILDINKANPILLTNARIRFNMGCSSDFADPGSVDCYILPREANEIAWLQESIPSGMLNATVGKIKLSDCVKNGVDVKKRVDFSDPNLMISGRYMEKADGSRQISFEPYTELNFTGTSVAVNGSGDCYFEIDGVPHKENGQYKSIALSSGKVLDDNLAPGNHCVRLYAKSQRCNYTIKEFFIDSTAQTLPPSYNKTIEFIGSSSLVAYTDSRDPHEGYDSSTSYMISFAYQTGKLLQNDGFRFNTVAYGGSGAVFHGSANGAASDGDKDYLTMQDRYKLEHEYWGGKGTPEATPVGTWDHSKYVPDYVALYLGANDLGQGLDIFKTNYKGFIDQLLGYYPNAVIIAMAPYNTNATYATALESIVDEYNSKQVKFINTLNWGVSPSQTDGLHAVAADHAVLAQRLYSELHNTVFPQIKSASLTLTDSLALNYYTKNNGKLVITHNGKTTELTGTPDGANGYKFEYKGITPQCMNDEIKAEYKVDGKTVDSLDSYSVKQYCNDLMGKTAGELGYSAEKYAAMKTLLADMLDYGAAAQKYRNHNMQSLANTDPWVALYRSSFTAPQSCANLSDITDESYRIYSAGVRVEDVIRLYFKFRVASWNNVTINVSRNGESIGTYSADDITGGDTLYLDAVYATEFDDTYVVTLKYGNLNMQSAVYSVNSYIASQYNGTNSELVQALGRYGASANSFRGA